METTIQDILTRRSVRAFDARKVSREDIDTLIRAGLSAPSAHGKAPWHIAVLENPDIREKIASAMTWHQPIVKAPLAFMVLGNPEACVQKEYWLVDCAALTENVLVAARALGLGSVWCGIAPNDGNIAAIRSVLDIPAPLVPFGMIAVGYPAQPGAFHERKASGDEGRVTWNPSWIRP